MTPLLEAKEIRASYGPRKVLHAAGLSLQPGEVLGLIGPNGSGKSTLLRAIMGILPCDTGEVAVMGDALQKISREALARRIAYLPQGAVCHWPLPVEQVVALGRIPHNDRKQEPVESAMCMADVARFAGRNVMQLSFGERLRVLLARALAVQAPVLLADEPVASLDPGHQMQVMELLRGLASQEKGVVVVLHDLALAAHYCDRLILLHEGHVLAEGLPPQVLTDANMRKAYGIIASPESGQTPYAYPWKRSSGDTSLIPNSSKDSFATVRDK